MIRFALILLMSLAVSSQAVAANSNNNPSNTIQNLNIEHLSNLFYPSDILDKFGKVPQFKKKKYCEMKGNVRQLNEIEVPRKVSGLTSRMFESTNLVGVIL